MKQDRFLIGILIGVGVLIIAALTLFFVRQGKQEYSSGNSPEDVVHNYVLAVIKQDYQKAYGYLADLPNKPTLDQFRKSFLTGVVNPNNAGIVIDKAEISGDDAVVNMSIVYAPSDPFSSSYRNPDRAFLVRQGGEWKLSTMPYPYWDYSWYQALPTPMP
ncbi:MAG: hypothetical protein ACP5QU_10870 [Anaerolineae bacterium]